MLRLSGQAAQELQETQKITRPTFGVFLDQVFNPDFPAELQQSNGESARFTGPRNRRFLWLYWTNFENFFTVTAAPTWATWGPWVLRRISTLVGSRQIASPFSFSCFLFDEIQVLPDKDCV